MSSEAAKNPVLDVRKELEALRDRYKQAAHIHHAHGEDHEASIYEGRSMDMQELLQRIPEGWDMRPREPSVTMVRAAADLGAPFGVGALWVAMWDAAKAEGGG